MQLVRFLRLLCVSGDDAFLLEGIFRDEVWDFMNEPVSRPNEEAVNELLATRYACLYTDLFPSSMLLLQRKVVMTWYSADRVQEGRKGMVVGGSLHHPWLFVGKHGRRTRGRATVKQAFFA